MKRRIQLALVGLAAVFCSASLLQSKPEYTRKEGKSCATCHVKAGAKELNEVGKCYEKSKSLKDCTAQK